MVAPFRALIARLISNPYALAVRTGLIAGDRQRLGPAIHAELVGFLFATLSPLAIIGLTYFALGLIAFRDSGLPFIAAVGMLGTATAATLFGVALTYRTTKEELRDAAAAVWERRYAIGVALFSACLGLLSAALFLDSRRDVTLLAIALLYAYCAGVVARLCIRPRIAVASLLLAIMPAIAAMIANPSFERLALAGFSLVFLFGSFETVFHIYRAVVSSLTMRFETEALARRDELTGLPNRRETRERLAIELARVARSGGLIAVHCLDLDHFKSANDRFGHPIGDFVLKEVAARLARLVRAGDLVGRIGGDEFLVVQTHIAHPSEAEMLAMRIIRSLGRPFEIQGSEIVIGASIGIALAPTDSAEMTTLIKYADAALYRAKARAASGYAFHKDMNEEARGEAGETGRRNAGPLSA